MLNGQLLENLTDHYQKVLKNYLVDNGLKFYGFNPGKVQVW